MLDADDMPLILVAEDEPPLSEMISYNLEKNGFRTLSAFEGDGALKLAANHQVDAMILDWMMPGKSGVEVCLAIRSNPRTATLPIIMLTARGHEDDRIYGLEAGADDYIVKPFSPRELVARVRAILRRSREDGAADDIILGMIAMNTIQHKVSVNDMDVKLGPTEYRLLRFLMESPGRVFSRKILLERVWTKSVFVESRTVDVHVRRLRKALMDAGISDPIRTVRGSGYSIDIEGQSKC